MKRSIQIRVLKRHRWLGLSLLFIVSACEQNDYSYFPDYPVSFRFNTTLVPYNSLAPAGAIKNVKIPQLASDRLGFGGLILVHGYDNEFYAYDMACPVELIQNIQLTSKVEVSEHPISATCPQCGSVYDLTTSGAGYPFSGKAVELKRRLKPYRIINVGNSEYSVIK